MNSRKVDLSGRKFGRLTVIGRSERGPSNSRYWACRCDCGALHRAATHSLTSGAIVSCGCYQKQRTAARNRRHGMTGSPEYKVYRSMMDRCYRAGNKSFENYGGRGIQVCDEWRASFAQFLSNMGPRPSTQHTLERVNNQLGYSPLNCVWADRSQQAVNRRRFATNTSGVTGVRPHVGKDGKVFYRASAQFRRRRAYLGSFPTMEAAVAARAFFFSSYNVK